MLLDIDHFEHVNDTCGHAAGDAILVELARRLRSDLGAAHAEGDVKLYTVAGPGPGMLRAQANA